MDYSKSTKTTKTSKPRTRTQGATRRMEKVDLSKPSTKDTRKESKPKRVQGGTANEKGMFSLGRHQRDVVSEKSSRLTMKPTQDELEICYKVLGLNDDQKSQVAAIDRIDNMVMLHHTEDANPYDVVLDSIRGTIIDLDARRILVPSSSMRSHSVVSDIVGTTEQKYFRLMDTELTTEDDNGNKIPLFHCVPNDEYLSICPYFPGFNIRFFKHKGRYYFASRTRIDTVGDGNHAPSSWTPFLTSYINAYYEAGGPLHDQLFPEETLCSRFVYCFLIYYPSYNLISKLKTSERGFVVHTGTIDAWAGLKTLPYSEKEIGKLHERPTVFKYEEEPFLNGGLTNERRLTVSQANCFLNFGYRTKHHSVLDFTRSGPGESVILKYRNPGSDIMVRLHVKSPSFANAEENIHGNDPNLYRRFVQNSKIAYETRFNHRNITDCHSLYRMPPDSLLKDFAFRGEYIFNKLQMMSPSDIPKHFGYQEAYNVIWLSMLVSSSQYYAPQVYKFRERFRADRDNLISWMMDLSYPNQPIPIVGTDEKTLMSLKRVQDILTSISKKMKKMPAKTVRNRAGRVIKVHDRIVKRDMLEKYLVREDGKSLYKLFRLANAARNVNTIHITEPDAVLQRDNMHLTKEELYKIKYDPNRTPAVLDLKTVVPLKIAAGRTGNTKTFSEIARNARVEDERTKMVSEELSDDSEEERITLIMGGKEVDFPMMDIVLPDEIRFAHEQYEEFMEKALSSERSLSVERESEEEEYSSEGEDMSVTGEQLASEPIVNEDSTESIQESVTEVIQTLRRQDYRDERELMGETEPYEVSDEEDSEGVVDSNAKAVMDVLGDEKKESQTPKRDIPKRMNINWALDDDEDLTEIDEYFNQFVKGRSFSTERKPQETPLTSRSVVRESSSDMYLPKPAEKPSTMSVDRKKDKDVEREKQLEHERYMIHLRNLNREFGGANAYEEETVVTYITASGKMRIREVKLYYVDIPWGYGKKDRNIFKVVYFFEKLDGSKSREIPQTIALEKIATAIETNRVMKENENKVEIVVEKAVEESKRSYSVWNREVRIGKPDTKTAVNTIKMASRTRLDKNSIEAKIAKLRKETRLKIVYRGPKESLEDFEKRKQENFDNHRLRVSYLESLEFHLKMRNDQLEAGEDATKSEEEIKNYADLLGIGDSTLRDVQKVEKPEPGVYKVKKSYRMDYTPSMPKPMMANQNYFRRGGQKGKTVEDEDTKGMMLVERDRRGWLSTKEQRNNRSANRSMVSKNMKSGVDAPEIVIQGVDTVLTKSGVNVKKMTSNGWNISWISSYTPIIQKIDIEAF